ncbi:MAG TPA: hypothetical protein EYP85_03065 [Armatimonadetes bacterium]|nr:hypothetical protein [Armatimonadota bacterium]
MCNSLAQAGGLLLLLLTFLAGSGPKGIPPPSSSWALETGEGRLEEMLAAWREEIANPSFADEDDLKQYHRRFVRWQKALGEGREKPGQDFPSLAEWLDLAVVFTSPIDPPGATHEVVSFAHSPDPALATLREKIRLPVPPGGAVVRLYRGLEAMPPPIRVIFQEAPEARGFTVLCRYVAVNTQHLPAPVVRETISHELAHAYLKSSLGLASSELPRWFHEGCALYLSNAQGLYIAHQGTTTHISYAPKDYNEYRLAFRYLEATYGQDRLFSFIRTAMESRTAEQALRETTGLSSYRELLRRTHRWHFWQEAKRYGTATLGIMALIGLLIWRHRQRRKQEVAQAEEKYVAAVGEAQQAIVDLLTRPELPPDRVVESWESLGMARVREGEMLWKEGHKETAQECLEEVLRDFPPDSRPAQEARRLLEEMKGIRL